jgi:hypothetical protein
VGGQLDTDGQAKHQTIARKTKILGLGCGGIGVKGQGMIRFERDIQNMVISEILRIVFSEVSS